MTCRKTSQRNNTRIPGKNTEKISSAEDRKGMTAGEGRRARRSAKDYLAGQ